MRNSLFVYRDPSDDDWRRLQLGDTRPPSKPSLIIGWRQIPAPIDAGVPPEIAEALAAAWVSLAQISFLAGADLPPGILADSATIVQWLPPLGWFNWLSLRRDGGPREVAIVTTRSAEVAMRLFDDDVFHWWTQGQWVLFSQPQTRAPVSDREAASGLFDSSWQAIGDLLDARALLAVLRPGVDGDVAGIVSHDLGFIRSLEAAMEEHARAASIEWLVTDGPGFYTAGASPEWGGRL